MRSDMARAGLDALFERLLANGAEEVVEQLAQLWTDDQVAGGVSWNWPSTSVPLKEAGSFAMTCAAPRRSLCAGQDERQ